LNKKIVIFGAGKIGRSFIGQVFSRSGYEVVFIDIDERIIEELNSRKEYSVIIKEESKDEEILEIKNVRGILATDTKQIITEIADSDIMAISVGKNGLPYIIETIAQGLEHRYKKDPNLALDIILAENMHNADKYVREELCKFLPASILWII